MIEYMIRTCDGEWFNLHRNSYAEVLKPKSFASQPASGWGDHRIKAEGVEISFSYEDPGIQVIFEGDLPEALAMQIVDEIRESIEKVTNQKGYVISLAGDKPIRF
jgi:hypothetical protein